MKNMFQIALAISLASTAIYADHEKQSTNGPAFPRGSSHGEDSRSQCVDQGKCAERCANAEFLKCKQWDRSGVDACRGTHSYFGTNQFGYIHMTIGEAYHKICEARVAFCVARCVGVSLPTIPVNLADVLNIRSSR